MTNEKTNSNEYLAQVVPEAARMVTQTMAVAGTARTEYVRPRMSGPSMKQPTFDWKFIDKYAQLRNFKLEVKNLFQNCNISQTERVSTIKKLARQAMPATSSRVGSM